MSKNQQYEVNIREIQSGLYGLMNTIASDNLTGDKDKCLDKLRDAIQYLGWAIDELKESGDIY